MKSPMEVRLSERDARHQALLDLILDVSFERREVTLASGRKSHFYLDLRQTLMRPQGVALAGELVLEKILAGPPVAAVVPSWHMFSAAWPGEGCAARGRRFRSRDG